jgi:hypothetical protein
VPRSSRGNGAALDCWRLGIDTVTRCGHLTTNAGGFAAAASSIHRYSCCVSRVISRRLPSLSATTNSNPSRVGSTVRKICVDCKPYGYTADEIRLVIREAAKAGLKVEGTCRR